MDVTMGLRGGLLAAVIFLAATSGVRAGGQEPEAGAMTAPAVDSGAAAAAEIAAGAAPPGPEEIVVGAYVNDVQELDFRTHSYAVDLYVWFRWRNKDLNPSKTLEFMNRYAPDDHVRDLIYEEPKELPDGSLYAIVRNQGRFSTKFALEKFPFDKQQLRIVLEDSTGGTATQVYRPDEAGIAISPDVQVPGFRIGTPRLEIRENRYPTNFGDTTVADQESYSRAQIIVPIERPLTALSVKTFLPILLIILCAGLVLFVRPSFVDARVGLGITALLTLVALQLAGGNGLPEVDYLTMVDKVYLASYAFIMLVLARVVRASWSPHERTEREVAGYDRLCLLLLLLAYAGTVAGVGISSLGTA